MRKRSPFSDVDAIPNVESDDEAYLAAMGVADMTVVGSLGYRDQWWALCAPFMMSTTVYRKD